MKDLPASTAGRDVGIVLTLAANAIAMVWMQATLFDGDAFHDGYAAILTLAFPAFLGGLALGLIARASALNVASVAGLLFCVLGFLHPFWRVPAVSRHTPADALLPLQPDCRPDFLGRWRLARRASSPREISLWPTNSQFRRRDWASKVYSWVMASRLSDFPVL